MADLLEVETSIELPQRIEEPINETAVDDHLFLLSVESLAPSDPMGQLLALALDLARGSEPFLVLGVPLGSDRLNLGRQGPLLGA